MKHVVCMLAISLWFFTLFSCTSTLDKFNSPTSPIVKVSTSQGASCTGTVVDDSYVLTAAHCVIDINFIMRNFGKPMGQIEGRPKPIGILVDNIPVLIRGVNFDGDLAILYGDFSNRQKLQIYDEDTLAIAKEHELMICGFPLGGDKVRCYTQKVVGGIYDRLVSVGEGHPGMSGAALLIKGSLKVIGVFSSMSSTIEDDTNIGYNLIGYLTEWKHLFSL